MTSVAVNTYTHSVTYVADNILKSLKDIIRLSGLDPSNHVASGASKIRARRTRLVTGELARVVLEGSNQKKDALCVSWDKIGRVSLGGRVCQYVRIWGGV